MSFASYCKECSCWCIFTVSAVIMLIMLSFTLKDLALVSEQQALVQQIINTPILQLSCTQICQSWFSQESGVLCCDRYNMELCVAKEKCKRDYIKSSETAVQILQNDQIHQVVVMVVCALIMIMIVFHKRKEAESKKVQQELDINMMKMMAEMVSQVRRQMKDGTIIFFGQQQTQNHSLKKNISVSTAQDNSNQAVRNSMSDSIVNSDLSKNIRSQCFYNCSKINSR